MGLSLLLPGREVSTCQSFYYRWPSRVTPPWQARLFPTATSSRIKQATGTRVTSLFASSLSGHAGITNHGTQQWWS